MSSHSSEKRRRAPSDRQKRRSTSSDAEAGVQPKRRPKRRPASTANAKTAANPEAESEVRVEGALCNAFSAVNDGQPDASLEDPQQPGYHEAIKQVVPRSASKSELRKAKRALLALGPMTPECQELVWQTLRFNCPARLAAALVLDVAYDAAHGVSGGHQLDWLTQRLCDSEESATLVARAFTEDLDLQALALQLQALREPVSPGSKATRAGKAVVPDDLLWSVAAAIAVALRYRNDERCIDTLLAIAAALPPASRDFGLPRRGTRLGADGLAEALFEVLHKPVVAGPWAKFLGPLWSRLRQVRRRTAELQEVAEAEKDRAQRLQDELQEVIADRQQAWQRVHELETVLSEAERRVNEAEERYAILKRTVDHALRDERLGVLADVQERLNHELMIMELALEGHQEEKDAAVVLERISRIRSFLKRLEGEE